MDPFSRTHPLTCFLFFAVAVGFGAVLLHPAYLAAALAAGTCWTILLYRRKALGRIGGLAAVFAVLTLLNPLFNTQGQTLLFTYFGRPYTLEALAYGAAVAAIFVNMLLWIGCYSKVMTSDRFLALFAPLAPALSLLLVMVLRLAPNLERRTRQIAGARACVGLGGGMKEGMAVLSALTSWALEGSVTTADAMNSRGYGTGRSTSFRQWRFTALDRGLLALMAVLAGAAAVGAFSGGAEARFLPTIYFAKATWALPAYGAFLFIPSVLAWKEALQWRILRSKI